LIIASTSVSAQKPVFKGAGLVPGKFVYDMPALPTKLIQPGDFQTPLYSTQNDRGYVDSYRSIVNRPVPANYYMSTLGFFCKREWELEKKIHIPFRFRLGSLEYCNYLEGKGERPIQ